MTSPRKKPSERQQLPGRDGDGTFLPGMARSPNAGQKPRPIELRHLQVLHDVFTDEEFKRICIVLKEECLNRQPYAMKLLFDRLIPQDWRKRLLDEDKERLKVIEVEYSQEFMKAMEDEARRKLKLGIAGPEDGLSRQDPA